jgi:hypothetical protein
MECPLQWNQSELLIHQNPYPCYIYADYTSLNAAPKAQVWNVPIKVADIKFRDENVKTEHLIGLWIKFYCPMFTLLGPVCAIETLETRLREKMYFKSKNPMEFLGQNHLRKDSEMVDQQVQAKRLCKTCKQCCSPAENSGHWLAIGHKGGLFLLSERAWVNWMTLLVVAWIPMGPCSSL